MTFLNPVMLAGVGAAVLPLVVHLLARARCRDVPWGAMMFLDRPSRRRSHTGKLRSGLLLATRMLMVAALAAALARPVVPGRWGGLARNVPVTAVIVLDRSHSMTLEEAGRSRLDMAREAALQILATLRRGDEAALVLLDDEVEVRPAGDNLQALARELAEVTASTGTADVLAGLAAAQRILERATGRARELYVVCDRHAVSWRNVTASAAPVVWLRQQKTVRLCVVPVGADDAENVAVEAVNLVGGLAVRGQSVEVEVQLRNYGQRPYAGVELTLWASGPNDSRRRLKTTTVNLPPRGTTAARMSAVFDQTGSHVLTAEIKSPGLPGDNRFDTAIDVMDPVQVLLVSGNESGPEVRRESFFARLALAPFQTAQKRSGDGATVTVRSAEEWTAADLWRCQVVVLANVPEITRAQARALEQRVYEGAGLIVCPGSLARPEAYNSVLYRDGLGLLPARLLEPTPADGSEATTLGSLHAEHPVFRFASGTAAAAADAVVGRYFPAEPRADATVLGSYASGRPFLIEGRRGRGRVVLMTCPLNAEWSTLPLTPFYLPLVQSLVRYACAPAVPARNLDIGEPIVATFEEGVEQAHVDRAGERLASTVGAGGTQVRCSDTRRPGIYRVHVRLKAPQNPWRTVHFVVQRSRAESDVRSLSAQEWRQIERATRMVRLDAQAEPLADAIESGRGGRELWLVLLACAVFLGVCELWLGRLLAKEAA